jgi:hypothetical protein
MSRRGISIDYEGLLDGVPSRGGSDPIDHLLQVLPPLWQRAYRKMAQSPTRIHTFAHRDHHVLFDRPSALVADGILPGERAPEDRILVVYGQSQEIASTALTTQQKSLLGEAAVQLGAPRSRPYSPGSALGEAFDISLYPLYRDLDRERTSDGRAYRAMQRYCSGFPGTFCFTRLLYTSRSWCPSVIEHGLLKRDGAFWVRRFRNAQLQPRLHAIARYGRRLASHPSSVE